MTNSVKKSDRVQCYCGEFVRRRPATAMPTFTNEETGTEITFDVRYCDNGHVRGYVPTLRETGSSKLIHDIRENPVFDPNRTNANKP